MSLQNEIDKARSEIRTDGYPVSIGEWISIYEKEELDVHPEFQRFFRWSPRQKSRLVESVLLGIPIPQVFVAQREDGVWDVVDGLQRLSTIFQLVGILKDASGNSVPPLVLESTTYLPSLGSLRWQNDENPEFSLTAAQRLIIKRSKIDVSIVLKESGNQTKFELFQRLNTGGSLLSDQEMRNSLLVMLNRELFVWLKNLAEDSNFQECISLTDRAIEEQYDMELALRFIVFRTISYEALNKLGDIGDFLTDQVREIARDTTFDVAEEGMAFRKTFELLAQSAGSNSFRKYDKYKDRFLGGFSISAFEAIALGAGYNYSFLLTEPDTMLGRIKAVWSEDDFTQNSGASIRASTRLPKIVPVGRRVFGV